MLGKLKQHYCEFSMPNEKQLQHIAKLHIYATAKLDVVRYPLEQGADLNLGSTTCGGLDEAEA
jgi:hypothetical protein